MVNTKTDGGKTDNIDASTFYNKFLFWLPRLQPFIEESGRPPMSAQKFINFFRILYGCGLRISEGVELERRDFDLDKRTVNIRNTKTNEYPLTTVLPYDVEILENMFKTHSKFEKLFPIDRNIAWLYAKQAGQLGGLKIFQTHERRNIDGVWTSIFRLSCSKRMFEQNASIELIQRKLRKKPSKVINHPMNDLLDTLLVWENEQYSQQIGQFPPDFK